MLIELNVRQSSSQTDRQETSKEEETLSAYRNGFNRRLMMMREIIMEKRSIS